MVLIDMKMRPFVRAALASAYIALLVSRIFYLPKYLGVVEDTLLVPITTLSLLVLSVATMAYLFFSQPLLLLVEGKTAEGITFFLQTLFSFAAITFVLIVSLFLIF